MLFVELYIEFADTIIVCHGCDGVRKINIGKLSDLTYFIGWLNEARLILGGEEELKERGERERVCKVSWSDKRGGSGETSKILLPNTPPAQ